MKMLLLRTVVALFLIAFGAFIDFHGLEVMGWGTFLAGVAVLASQGGYK